MSKKNDKYRLGKKRHQFLLASREDMDEEDLKTYRDFIRENGVHYEQLRIPLNVGGSLVHRRMAEELQVYFGFENRSSVLQYLIETAYFQAKEQGFDYVKEISPNKGSSKRSSERWEMRRKLGAARREARREKQGGDEGVGGS